MCYIVMIKYKGLPFETRKLQEIRGSVGGYENRGLSFGGNLLGTMRIGAFGE